MIVNPQLQSYYTDKSKKTTVMIISGIFTPSSFESFDCKITMKKKFSSSKWEMEDICILKIKRNRYESIHSLYSYILLDKIMIEIFEAITLDIGA
ncbi:hypothetical protein [Ferdinandcohnia sp. SAFN-114]|uniref:hypothetical protein n=1 Tax=Ferdinandcohnia sp. SAFN-114 TaxID=3387275 RepID=UPI003F814EB4